MESRKKAMFGGSGACYDSRMEDRSINFSITTGAIVKTVVVLALAALLFAIRDIVLVVLTAIIIASAIEPAVLLFVRWNLPRVLSVLFVYIILLLGIGVLFYFFLPVVVGDLIDFISSFPRYIEELTTSGFFTQYGSIIGFGHPTVSTPDILQALNLQDLFSAPIGAAAAVFGGFFSFILIIVLSFYFAVIETGVDDFLRVITPHIYQSYMLGLWRRSQHKIGLWMQGQVLLAVIMGVLVYLGLTIFGVPHALVLAVITACFEIIPVFGVIFAGALAVAIAFAAGGISLGLITLAFYVVAQQFENHLIYPLVVTRVVGIPPLLVILAIIIGGQLWGFLGIIIAVPIAATLRELARDYEAGRLPAPKEATT